MQSDIDHREKRIREATEEDVPLSEAKVQTVVEKWEVLETTSTDLSPVLQVPTVNPQYLVLFLRHVDVHLHVLMYWNFHRYSIFACVQCV